MKVFIITFSAFLLSFPLISISADYGVTGNGDEGYVYGEVDAKSGSKDVDGYLYNENGDEVYFSGEWSGNGEIEGYDENGNYIELEVD